MIRIVLLAVSVFLLLFLVAQEMAQLPARNMSAQKMKETTLPETNPFSVRDYYPDHIGFPSWIEEYISFHNENVLVDKVTNRTRLVEGAKFLVYSCRRTGLCGGLGDRTNGIATLFYAAVLSRRVLIIDHPDPFPLKDVLVPHRIRWDVDDYPQPQRQHQVIDGINRAIPFLKNPCQTDTEVQGIQIKVNQWYMRYLWPSKCMRDLLLLHGSSTTSGRSNVSDTSGAGIPVDEGDRHHTFRWAFWTLFRFSNDVEKEADRLRNQAGLSLAESADQEDTDKFRPYIAIHIRKDRQYDEDNERMFLDCAHKFQRKIKKMQQRDDAIRDIAIISDLTSIKERVQSWDNATVKISATEEFHTDSRQSWAAVKDQKKANLDVFAEVAILLDSECLVRSRSGYSELPQMIGISNEETMERCGVQFDQCSDDAVELAVRSLYWSRGKHNTDYHQLNVSKWSSWVSTYA